MTPIFHRLLVIALLCFLSGCSPYGFGMSQLQLNGETEKLSENYHHRVTEAVGEKLSLVNAQVSEPATIPGGSMLSPRRWFVCVRGQDLTTGGPLSAIVLLHESRPASAKVFTRAPLCDDLKYQPLSPS